MYFPHERGVCDVCEAMPVPNDDEDGICALLDAVRAASIAQQLADALREAEWVEVFSDHVVGDFICGGCGNNRAHGHDNGCSVADALRTASSEGTAP